MYYQAGAEVQSANIEDPPRRKSEKKIVRINMRALHPHIDKCAAKNVTECIYYISIYEN
jgi:hypothetical protein